MMENNKFKYKIENKRYHTWNYYLRQKFGTKVFKMVVSAMVAVPIVARMGLAILQATRETIW